MNFPQIVSLRRAAILLFGLSVLMTGCSGSSESADEHGDSHDSHDEEMAEPEKGPHGGRLLEDGDVSVELAIFETGVPPEYRAWVRSKGEAVPPAQVELTVTLSRLDGERNVFRFRPVEDFLQGDGVVTEPHSFSVVVAAKVGGAAHEWRYDSFEGRVIIPAASAKAAGVEVSRAGPATIRDVLPLYGKVILNPEAVREVSAKFPGTVQSVAVTAGQSVAAGALLARVESSDSLQSYRITSPIAGVVTERRSNPGEATGSGPLFVISDLNNVWVELSVFPQDVGRVRIGQPVRILGLDRELLGEARVARIAAAAIAGNQALQVWAKPAGALRLTPGRMVGAEVLVGGAEVPLAVRSAGLQAFRDFTVVFERVGETYEVRMLELGRTDGEFTEVLGGLKPGVEYVSGNSYLIKADIEKSGASHDH